MAVTITIKVWCENEHLIGEWGSIIAEKYPFFCQQCEAEYGDGNVRDGKYPWHLEASAECTHGD